MYTESQLVEAYKKAEEQGKTDLANKIRILVEKNRLGLVDDKPMSLADTYRKALSDYNAPISTETIEPKKPPEETGMFGNLLKGVGSGYVGFGEMAALGAVVPLEEQAELEAREKIKSVAESLRPEGGDPDSHLYKLGQGLGSIGAILTAGLAGKAVAGTAGAIGLSGLLSAGAGTGEASERARAYGATEEERNIASLKGAGIGLTELLPLGRIFKTLQIPVFKNLGNDLGEEALERFSGRVRNAFVTGGYEAAQEASAAVLQNMAEQGYNPTKSLLDAGVGEEALIGGEAGALLQFFTDTFLRGKSGRYAELREQEKQSKQQAQPQEDQQEQFDDDDIGDLEVTSATVEQFATTEGLSIEEAKRILDYADRFDVSINDAREEIESLQQQVDESEQPKKVDPEKKQDAKKDQVVVGEKLPYNKTFEYIKNNVDQVAADKGIRIGVNAKGEPVIAPLGKRQQAYFEKQLKLKESKEEKDASVGGTDATATGAGVQGDVQGVVDGKTTDTDTKVVDETEQKAVEGSDADVGGPVGGKRSRQPTLDREVSNLESKIDNLERNFPDKKEEIQNAKAQLEVAKQRKEVQSLNIEVVRLGKQDPNNELKNTEKKLKRAEQKLKVAEQNLPTVIKPEETVTKLGEDKKLPPLKTEITPVRKRERVGVPTPIYTDAQLDIIRAEQGKKKRDLTKEEKQAAEVGADVAQEQRTQTVLSGYQSIVPDSQDPSTDSDRRVTTSIEKVTLPKATKGQSENILQKQAAQTYFSGVRRPVDGVINAIADIQLFETDPAKTDLTGERAEKVPADEARDYTPEQTKAMDAGRSYKTATRALQWARKNLSAELNSFIDQQIGEQRKDLIDKPPISTKQAETERKTLQQIRNKKLKESVDRAEKLKAKDLENLKKAYNKAMGRPTDKEDPNYVEPTNKQLRRYSQTSGKFPNAFAPVVVDKRNNRVVPANIAQKLEITAEEFNKQTKEQQDLLIERAKEYYKKDAPEATVATPQEGLTEVDQSIVDEAADNVDIDYIMDADQVFDDPDAAASNIDYDQYRSVVKKAQSLNMDLGRIVGLEEALISGDINKIGAALKKAATSRRKKKVIAKDDPIGFINADILDVIQQVIKNADVPIFMYKDGEIKTDIEVDPDTLSILEADFEKSRNQTYKEQVQDFKSRVRLSWAMYLQDNPKVKEKYVRFSRKRQDAIQAAFMQRIMDKNPDHVPDKNALGGYFSVDAGFIVINGDKELNAHTMLHELIHATTAKTLKDSKNPNTIKLKKLYEQAKSNSDFNAYGFADVDEFVAEAMTNEDFQMQLSRIYIQGDTLSVYQKFVNIIADIFQRLTRKPREPVYVPKQQTYDGAQVLKDTQSTVLAMLAPHNGGYSDSGVVDILLSVDMSTPQNAENLVKALENKLRSVSRPITPKEKESFIDSSREFLSQDIPEKGKQVLIDVAPSQAFADIASTINKKLGDIAMRAHKLFESQRGAIKKSDEKVDATLKRVRQLKKKLSSEQQKQLNDLITKATRDYEVDPTDNVDQYSKFWLAYRQHSGNNAPIIRKKFDTAEARDKAIADRNKKFPNNRAWKDGDLDQEKVDILPELKRELNSLPPEAKEIFTELRDMYTNQYKSLQAVLFGNVDDNVEDVTKRNQIKRDLYEKLFATSAIRPYFPLYREGKYTLTYNLDPKRFDERDQLQVEMFNTKKAVEDRIRQLRQDPTVVKDKNGNPKAGYSISGNTRSKIENVPPTKFVNEIIQYLKDAKVEVEVQDRIISLYLDSLPESNFAKTLRKRKGTLGFDTDHIGNVASVKGYDIGRQVERIRYDSKLRALEVELDNEKPTMKESFGLEAAVNSLRERIKFAINPTSANWSKQANRFAFIYTIGFNVSSALVNLSQGPLFVYPYLGARYGYGVAGKAIKDAQKVLVNAGASRRMRTVAGNEIDTKSLPAIINLFTPDKDGTYVINEDKFDDSPKSREFRKMVEEMQPLVQAAADRGQLNQSHLADSLNMDELSRKQSYMDKVTTASAWMFHNVEQYNRQMALVATYLSEIRTLKDVKGRDKLSDADLEAAAQKALYGVQETNAGSVAETGPRLSQTSIGRVALMYKPYGIQMYYTMAKSAKQLMFNLFPGSDAGARALRKQAFRELMGVHLTALFFAGVRGIPLYGAIKMIADFFLDDDEEDFDTEVRKNIGELLYKGYLTDKLGVDISSRAALSQLLFQANRYNQDASLEEQAWFYLTGPAGSTIKGMERGIKDMFNGQYYRGVEAMMPASVRNVLKTNRYNVDEGIKTRRGDLIYDDLTSGEMLWQIIGFAPSEYAMRQEQNMITKKIDNTVRKMRSKLLERYYLAIRSGDFDEQRSVLEEMREFSKDHPEATISAKTLLRSIKGHMRTSASNTYNGITISPTIKRALLEQRDEWDQGFQLFE